MSKFKQPKYKFFRVLKYLWIQSYRYSLKEDRAFLKGYEGCEICGRNEEDNVIVCFNCNRCNDENCNAGCIFCRSIKEDKYCKCCNQKVN